MHSSIEGLLCVGILLGPRNKIVSKIYIVPVLMELTAWGGKEFIT